MRLLGRDAGSRRRGARHIHHMQQAAESDELNHAPLATRDLFSFARLIPKLAAFVSATKRHNAAHHAPAGLIEHKSRADAGRVHALVRPAQSAGTKRS
jgi:hypothetical protein